MSKYKKANKPWQITNGITRLPICFTEKKHAKAHLKFIERNSKAYRGQNIYAGYGVAPRTDGVYA